MFCFFRRIFPSLTPVVRSTSALRNRLAGNDRKKYLLFKFLFGIPLSRGKGAKEKRKESHLPSPSTLPHLSDFLLMLPCDTMLSSSDFAYSDFVNSTIYNDIYYSHVQIESIWYRSEVGEMVVPMKGQTKITSPIGSMISVILPMSLWAYKLALHNNALCKVVCKCPCLRTVIPPLFFEWE